MSTPKHETSAKAVLSSSRKVELVIDASVPSLILGLLVADDLPCFWKGIHPIWNGHYRETSAAEAPQRLMNPTTQS